MINKTIYVSIASVHRSIFSYARTYQILVGTWTISR